MTYRSRSPEFWDAVEIDYRGGSKLADLFERHGLTKGEFDHLPEQAFFLIGGLDDLAKKAESLGAKL